MTTKILKNSKNSVPKAPTEFVHQVPLPYSENSLSPYISSKTLSFHYGKHYKAYIEKTNHLLERTGMEDLSLKEIIFQTAGRMGMESLFNNAAQAWNHSFYWKSMKPKGGGKPGGEILKLLKSSFGGFEDFKEQFEAAATSHFGSGWVWLVRKDDQLKIVETHDAENPLVHNEEPLITLDVWEHAYYLDYKNERADYVKAFLDHLVNWGFAEDNL
jgi:superoxide dismutase, Fe-Mn family